MKTILTYAAITIAIIAALAIAYQSLVVIPQNKIDQQAELARQERLDKALAEDRKEARYNSCIADAYANYSTNWDNTCDIYGKEANCTLLAYQYTTINELHKEAQDKCVTLYQAN